MPEAMMRCSSTPALRTMTPTASSTSAAATKKPSRSMGARVIAA